MRSIFREFYSIENVDLKNLKDDVIVVFDTNSLLNIYRYSSDTSKKFIDALQIVKDNIWIPYQVGLEFNLNRKKVMHDVKTAPSKFKTDFNKNINGIKNKFEDAINKYVVKSVDSKEVKKELIENFNEKINNLVQDFIDNDFSKIENLIKPDEDYLKLLIEVLEGKTGESYTQEQIELIVKEGADRYKNKIPPGYEDEERKKGEMTYFNGLSYESKYGDLIVWKQIIDKACDDKIKTVIFITDDNKEDWWYFIDKNERIGPRAELKNELIRFAKSDLIMINSNSFIQQIENTDTDIIEELNNYIVWGNQEDTIEELNNSIEDKYDREHLKFLMTILDELKTKLETDIKYLTMPNIAKKKYNKLLEKIYNLEDSITIHETLNLLNDRSLNEYHNEIYELKDIYSEIKQLLF